MRVVIDTNVFVSALLSAFGPSAQIVELIASSDISIVVDDRIVSEYSEVLDRSGVNLDVWDVEDFLRLGEDAEYVTAAPLPFALPDPDDEAFLEVAIAGGVDALVTGNEKHFKVPGGKLAVLILSPRRFLDVFAGR